MSEVSVAEGPVGRFESIDVGPSAPVRRVGGGGRRASARVVAAAGGGEAESPERQALDRVRREHAESAGRSREAEARLPEWRAKAAEYERQIQAAKARLSDAVLPLEAQTQSLARQIEGIHAQLDELRARKEEISKPFWAEMEELKRAEDEECTANLQAARTEHDRAALLGRYIQALELQAGGWYVHSVTASNGDGVWVGGCKGQWRRRQTPVIVDIVLKPNGAYVMLATSRGKYHKMYGVESIREIEMASARPMTERADGLLTSPKPCPNGHGVEQHLVASRWCCLCRAPVLWICSADPTHFERAAGCECVRKVPHVAQNDWRSNKIMVGI